MQGAQRNWFLWSIYFDFLLFCFVVICDLVHTVEPVHDIWLETHCPGILVRPRLFLFYLNKSDPIRILSHYLCRI